MSEATLCTDPDPAISEIGLSSKICELLVNLCKEEGYPATAASVCRFSREELLRVKGIGRKSLKRAIEGLRELGMQLAGEDLSPGGAVPERALVPAKRKPAFVPLPTIRGSSFNLGMICPGSVFLAQKARAMNVEQENQYTSVGHMGHKYLELRITKSQAAAEAYLDKEGASKEFRMELAELWVWLVEEDLLPALTKEEAAERGIQLFAEQALEYQAGKVRVTGTLDLVEVIHDAAVVVDWKFYNRPGMLPPIIQDMQMLGYAIGAWMKYDVRQVTVHRALCYHRRFDTLELDGEMLRTALEAITEEAERIWEFRHELHPGAQCRGCFQSFHCPAMAEQFKAVETREIQPYEGGEMMTRDDVLRFLLAVPVVEARIEEGIAAAKRFVKAQGEPIVDLTSGMAWGPKSRRQDVIADAAGCLGELMQITSQEEALAAAKTTKGGMEQVMKLANLKPKERRDFFDFLRERHLMVNVKTKPRWEWRRIKED